MPIFYRGAGLGTYWHMNDARITGFTPHYPGAGQGISRVRHHIARGTTASPYVSLTRSFGVAWGYAMAGKKLPSVAKPAYVYEIEIDENDGLGTRLLDPVTAIANDLGLPYETRTYHQDGDSSFLFCKQHHRETSTQRQFALLSDGPVRYRYLLRRDDAPRLRLDTVE